MNTWRVLRPAFKPEDSLFASGRAQKRECPGHPAMATGSLCLEIEAFETYMLHYSRFKSAIGGTTEGNGKFQPRLSSVRQFFAESTVGCKYVNKYSAFEACLKSKYNAAILFHCSNILGQMIMDVKCLPGSSEAKVIDRCLGLYPGIVHIWVTSKDMEALFFPQDEDWKLPYLYPPLPVSDESRTTYASEQRPSTAGSASCLSMTVTAATDRLPVSIL